MQPAVTYPEYSGQDDHGWYRQITTWACDGIHLTEDYCEFEPFPWHGGLNEQCGIGLVRRGAYRRRSRGVEALVDPNVGFLRFTNEEVEQAQFARGVRERSRSSRSTPHWRTACSTHRSPSSRSRSPRRSSSTTTGCSRAAAGRRRPHDARARPRSRDAARRATLRQRPSATRDGPPLESRRDLVSDACQVLHIANQNISLVGLADAVGCSPFHLSRVFGEITGMTIPQYRRQLRVHEAVDAHRGRRHRPRGDRRNRRIRRPQPHDPVDRRAVRHHAVAAARAAPRAVEAMSLRAAIPD